MFKITSCFLISNKAILSRLFIFVAAFFFMNDIYAAATSVTITSITKNVGSSVSQIAGLLEDIALITGVGFILASFFKFHQHKLNPTQVPLSQGITLIVIGAGLAVFPTLLTTATKGVFATGVSTGGTAGISGIVKTS